MIIVIEGVDGSGKQTQAMMLYEFLVSMKKNVKFQSFPNYKNDSSLFVKKYLNGEFGGLDSLTPFQASVFFALDRFCTMKEYTNFLNENGSLILDRYVSSNEVYQSCKINSQEKRAEFVKELKHFEFDNLNLPKPDVTIFLDLKPELSLKLRENRKKLKSETKQDIHEKNLEFLEKSYKTYKDCAKFNKWQTIKCYNSNGVLNKNDIQAKIQKIVFKIINKRGK